MHSHCSVATQSIQTGILSMGRQTAVGSSAVVLEKNAFSGSMTVSYVCIFSLSKPCPGLLMPFVSLLFSSRDNLLLVSGSHLPFSQATQGCYTEQVLVLQHVFN